MTHQTRILRRLAAGVAVLAALTSGPTACTSGGDAKPTGAAPSSTAPAPLPTQDWNRLACQALPTDWLELLDNLADTRKAAELAAKSNDPEMHRHGDKLLTAVTAREQADWDGDKGGAVDANLDISRAAIDMAAGCSKLYGDGNW